MSGRPGAPWLQALSWHLLRWVKLLLYCTEDPDYRVSSKSLLRPTGSKCAEEEEEIGTDRSSIHQTEAKSSGREMGGKMNEKRKWASKNFLSYYFILFQAILIKNLSIFSKHNTVSLIVYSYHSISMSRKDSKLSITSNLRTVIFRVSFKILKWHILNVLFG